MDEIRSFINRTWDESIVPTLCEYIKIPNKSPMFDPDWQEHGYMHNAIELFNEWCANSDLKNLSHRIVQIEGRTPLLFCEIPANTNSPNETPTVLLYGHYDKQPEFSGWRDGLEPWKPVIQDGRLYGRGGADDGYALFGSLTAIMALQNANLPHPRCVILIEGCEESGSYDLPYYVELLAEEIGTPALVICLDAECANYDQLWITTSLRGTVAGTLKVRVLREGIHSGAASGIVPSSFRIARQLLERIENANSGLMHEKLYVPIPAKVKEQTRIMARALGKQVYERFPWSKNTGPMNDTTYAMILNNTWEPTLSVTGISGAPEVGNAGNTLRPETQLKLSVRLPPTLDAQAAAGLLKNLLETDPPYDAEVIFEVENAQSGWAGPEIEDRLAACFQQASQNNFDSPVQYMPMGGTIPFMKMLGEGYPGVQFMVTGVLGPASNAHGPNEFLHIETGKRLTACVADVLAKIAVTSQAVPDKGSSA